MIRNDILQKFPDLFGAKKVNGRDVNVQETITALTRELRPEIAAALTARRQILESSAPVREKYAWPKWEEKFEDPIKGGTWTYRQIVQGMIDNFLGRETEWRWRLNDEVPIPKDAHPLKNPGLELTGPWHPLDMAFNALNSPAPMNMPDFEDASPTHFLPDGTPSNVPVGVFAALQNAKEIFAGAWTGKPYEVVKKGKTRAYNITKPPAQWPTRFGRPPGLHINYDHVTVDGRPSSCHHRRHHALGVQQLRFAQERGQRRLLLHPQTANAQRSADRGKDSVAAGRHDRHSRRLHQDQDAL